MTWSAVLIAGGIITDGANPPTVSASTLSDFEMIVDINEVNDDSRPDNFLSTASGLYFTANDGIHGQELWRTNGTVTQLVADINPDGSSSPNHLVELGDEVFFSAFTPEFGHELWKTDGTETGTVLVSDIRAGSSSSSPEELVAFNGEVWFSADDDVNGRELWHSDGTELGTTMFDDLFAGAGDFNPDRLTPIDNALGNLLVFAGEIDGSGLEVHWLVAGETSVNSANFNADDDTNPQLFQSAGGEVYYLGLSDGVFKLWRLHDVGGVITAELIGGHNVGAIAAAPASNPTQVFFGSATAGDPTNVELYKVVGGTAVIESFDEINASGSARISNMVPFKNGVMFRADDGVVDTELWVSDGTQIGTRLVEDLYPGVDNHSVPSRLTPAGPNHVVFQAVTDADREMWVSDGTEAGTFMVADINPSGGSNPSVFTGFGGAVYFAADDPVEGRELFRGNPQNWTEGATDNVAVFVDIHSGTADSEAGLFTALGDKIFASADDGVHGPEPVLIDPVARTSTLIKDVFPGEQGSEPYDAVSLGDTVAFAAYDEDHGSELWLTDGTEVGTTVLDIVPGPDSSGPSELFAWNGLVLFNAEDDVAGSEPWVSDGTLAGTMMLADISAADSYPDDWVVFGDLVAFLAEVEDGEKQVFITDGTVAGTRPLYATPTVETAVNDIAVLGDRLLFDADGLLWSSDGTEVGTSPFGPSDVRAPDGMFVSGDLVYMVLEGVDTSDRSVWASDGTTAGSVEVLVLGGDLGGRVEEFAPLAHSSVVFTLFNDAEGEELYVSDGTSAGTNALSPINPGPENGPGDAFVTTQDRAFFTADDAASGTEWWTTDGADATRLADVFPGGQDGADGYVGAARDDRSAGVVGGWFIARAEAPGMGTEPWFVAVTPSVPDAPTGVTALLSGDSSVTVSWAASPNEPGAPTTGYVVTSNPGGLTCATTSTSCEVDELALGTDYTFTVTASNSSGTSDPSAPSNVVTTPNPPISAELDAAARFVPLSPQRIFDTRPAEPAPGPKGIVGAGETIDVQIAGVAGIPNDAVAVVMNLTVVNPSAAGFVTAFPKGTAQPNASSINIQEPGQVRPNLVTVLIGDDGKVSLFSLAQAHLLGDVAGYYTDQDGPTAAGRFVAVTPHRLFDTRPNEPAPGPKGKLQSGETIDVDALNFPTQPGDDIAAVVMNITGTASDAAGFITAFPTGESLPTASNINLGGAGATAPNLAIVPVGEDGEISFYSFGGVHLLADVTGYITGDGSPESTAGLFVALEPTRVFDTRAQESPPGPKGYVLADSSIDAQVAGVAGVPDDASAVVLNVVGIASPLGFLTVWNTGPARPTASTLNFAAPIDTRANAAMVRIGDGGKVSFYTLSGSHILADTAGYFLG